MTLGIIIGIALGVALAIWIRRDRKQVEQPRVHLGAAPWTVCYHDQDDLQHSTIPMTAELAAWYGVAWMRSSDGRLVRPIVRDGAAQWEVLR